MRTFQKVVNDINESRIVQYHVDFLNNRLDMCVITLDGGEARTHNLSLQEISNLSFFNDIAKNGHLIIPPDKEDYLELTTLGIIAPPVKIGFRDTKETWIDQFSGDANIYLELWSKLIFLYAKTVIIDDRIFSYQKGSDHKMSFVCIENT